MDQNTTKQIVGKYSDAEKALAREFFSNKPLYEFVKRQITEGITKAELDSDNLGDLHKGWLNQVAVKHIGIPLQSGGQVNKDGFLEEAQATYKAINLLEEAFGRMDIVANFKETEPEVKKKPSLK